MKHSLKTGFCFGLTSGIITTLGLMVGLHAGTHSKLAIIGGILTIAIADAFSDALGIHVSEESEGKHTSREVWESTLSTFLTKFVFAVLFIIPVLLFPLMLSIVISVVLGLLLLAIFSYFIGQSEKSNPWIVVAEHLLIAILVIILTNYVGVWISAFFN